MRLNREAKYGLAKLDSHSRNCRAYRNNKNCLSLSTPVTSQRQRLLLMQSKKQRKITFPYLKSMLKVSYK